MKDGKNSQAKQQQKSTKMQKTTKDIEKAAKRAADWAGAGDKAHALALTVEKAALEGEIVPMTKENLRTTIRGALKLFFDGNIADRNIAALMQKTGLDMTNLRRSLVEQTIARAVPKIVNTGDIERLLQLGALIGESSEKDTTTVTREELLNRMFGIAEQSDPRTQAIMYQWIYNELGRLGGNKARHTEDIIIDTDSQEITETQESDEIEIDV